jgi:hypothetical protein
MQETREKTVFPINNELMKKAFANAFLKAVSSILEEIVRSDDPHILATVYGTGKDNLLMTFEMGFQQVPYNCFLDAVGDLQEGRVELEVNGLSRKQKSTWKDTLNRHFTVSSVTNGLPRSTTASTATTSGESTAKPSSSAPSSSEST